MLDAVIKKIEEQQKRYVNTPAFVVGEHLKDILKKASSQCCEIVLKDLDVEKMSIAECEKLIAEYARKHRNGNVGFCPPNVAEEIICKFYGILPKEELAPVSSSFVDLSDFI